MKSVWRLFMQKIQDRRKKVEEYKYRPARTSGRCSRAGVSGYDRPFGDQIQHGPFHLRHSGPSSNAEVTNEEKSNTPLDTKEDYQSLLTLKTADYENLTVVEFNNNLVEWSTQNMDGAYTYTTVIENDIAVHQFPEYLDAEERSFLSLTVKASNNENSVQMRSDYGKPPIDSDLSFELLRENMELNPPVWTQLMYGFSYQFDANKLTVGERDLALAKVINEVQNFWNSTDIKVLANMSSDDMLEQLKAIVETCSTETVKMSVVENYFMFQTSEMLE